MKYLSWWSDPGIGWSIRRRIRSGKQGKYWQRKEGHLSTGIIAEQDWTLISKVMGRVGRHREEEKAQDLHELKYEARKTGEIVRQGLSYLNP